MPFTEGQFRAIETTERVASTFSLLGCAFIFITFLVSSKFRRPINRLIFYASWGNTLCNVGTLMGLAGIRAGQNSGLCQLQGFLIQLFVPADAFWNLSMAINVYLTVFKKYNVEDLKSLEWIYLLLNYGGPFIPAFVCIFVSTPGQGRIYGNATLWCWIDTQWDYLRVALLYGPAWVAILTTFVIYAWAGNDIYKKRRQLRSFSVPLKPPAIENPFTSYKTTEIQITSSELSDLEIQSENGAAANHKSRNLPSQSYEPYSIRIERGPSALQQRPPGTPGAQATTHRQHNAALEANTAAWGYTKCALMFFASLLITWVPSSANRVYSLVHPGVAYFPLAYSAGLVLPLMGFWNFVIYVTTSWGAVKSIYKTNRHRFTRPQTWAQAIYRRRGMGRSTELNSVEDGRGPMKSPASLSDSMRGLAV